MSYRRGKAYCEMTPHPDGRLESILWRDSSIRAPLYPAFRVRKTIPEIPFFRSSGMVFFMVCTDFAPRVGARAACRAREGIGGSETKPIVQTKSAADSRLSRLPRAGGTRRGASYVPRSRIFAEPKIPHGNVCE